MEQWQINRAGVINFWYYDEDEFMFEEGRLLLRGANGSGKSVTMQSLVPLLFDGNKSPERLDPFGSRARKMESYLLSDGLDLEERVGYLFLEFAKKEAGRYLTIGMGMRARKNMPMQTWYFIVLDNRRVGHHYDLSLYKDLGEKIPLSQKELENKIGLGGQLFASQKEYKNAVNEHLFGYEDVSDFDELIELLIQIRSPKLSKEFKPTTMYEIMQSSLITLSDDDLRPMSEAIENMDEIKTKVESLESAKKALQKIDTAYVKYNTYVLANKSHLFNKSYEQEKHLSQELSSHKQKAADQKLRFETLTRQIEQLEMEEEQLKAKVESLKQHDLSKLSEEKKKLENSVTLEGNLLKQKEEQLNTQKSRERELDKKMRDKKAQLELEKEAVLSHLVEMKELSSACLFEEHDYFESEYLHAYEESYSFSYLDHQVATYKSQLKVGLNVIMQLEKLNINYDEALQKLEIAKKEKEQTQKEVKNYERLFNEMKSEYSEKMFRWQENNQVFRVPREVLTKATESVYRFGEGIYYDQIMAPIREVYHELTKELNQEIATLGSNKKLLNQQWQEKQTALEVLKNQKNPEPFREEKVLKNRVRLSEANIPFMPLYKAIDFAPHIEESLKGNLEEALLDLGILDALVVSPEHKEVVMKMDVGMADKYIFSNPEILSYNLSEYLKPDAYDENIAPMVVDDVLKSLFLNPDAHKIFVSEKGAYGMGIIWGQISGHYQSKFIGFQSRKRYKQQLMDDITTQMYEIKEKMTALQMAIDSQNSLVAQAAKELDQFPKTEDLMVALQDFQSMLTELKRHESIVEQAQQTSESIYHQLKDQRLLVHEKTAKSKLSVRSEVYAQAIADVESYSTVLSELKLKDKECLHLKEMIRDLEQQYESCLESIEIGSGEVSRLTRTMQQIKERIQAINHELSLSDYQEIISQLESFLGRLQQVPKETKQVITEHAALKAAIDGSELTLETLEKEFIKAGLLVKIYAEAFRQEYELHYVEKEDIPVTYALSVKVFKIYQTVLEEKKQLQELREELQERFLRESSELLEYNLKRIDLFRETHIDAEDVVDQQELGLHIQRMDIVAKVSGQEVKFYELFNLIEEQIRENGALLDEQDRELFEDILIKSISRKISSKIYHSEKWVEKINALMEGMNTSSGLKFSLKWLTQKAESEDQLGTKELVDILKMDQGLLTVEHRERLIKHFRSKIQESKNRSADDIEQRSFLTVMKEILDYRKWFEFQLFFTKTGDVKKELTNNAFGTFSGGEKAMAMYVPLFSAVYAKYQGGRPDCPKVISLDEAFAGVDEKNIKDMFKLLVELKLSFVANSQVLFGDYETVPALSIYELIRPENVTFVTLIRYKWNGVVRALVSEVGD